MSRTDKPLLPMMQWWERKGRQYIGDRFSLAYLAWAAALNGSPGAIATAMTDKELLREQELRGRIRPYPTAPNSPTRSQNAGPATFIPVAHMLLSSHSDGQSTLHMCEAEDGGAFVVYRKIDQATHPAAGAAVASVNDDDASADREPLAWLNEDELPPNYPYDAMFPYSKVDVVRMFPVFGPSAADGVGDAAEAKRYRALSVLGCNPNGFPPDRILCLSTLGTFLDRWRAKGTWHACQRCCSTQPTALGIQRFYSDLLGCHIGDGCQHCDGIGAAWTPPAPKAALDMAQAGTTAATGIAGGDKRTTEEFTLRAMAANYDDDQLWDALDRKVCVSAANEIKSLRAALARQKVGGDAVLSAGDLELFATTYEHFDDGVDTTTDAADLMRFVRMGLLECMRYAVTEKGSAIYAARAQRAAAQGDAP